MATTPWNEVKADYLKGVTPKELAIKYNVPAKSIHEKASKENWVDEKTSIVKNLQEDVQGQIKDLTVLSLKTLKEIIEDKETDRNVKVQACKAALDISGLKSSKQVVEATGFSISINNEPVNVEAD